MCNKVVVFYCFEDLGFFDKPEVTQYRKDLLENSLVRVSSEIYLF